MPALTTIQAKKQANVILTHKQRKALETAQEAVATALARDGITVIFDSPIPCVDLKSKTMHLPALPEEMRSEDETVLRGWLDHEVSHVIFSDVEWPKRALRTPTVKIMCNMVEDTRVDKLMFKRYYGSKINIEQSTQSAHDGAKPNNPIQAGILLVGDVGMGKDFDEALDLWSSRMKNPMMIPVFRKMVESGRSETIQAHDVSSTAEAIDCGIAILDKWKDVLKDLPKSKDGSGIPMDFNEDEDDKDDKDDKKDAKCTCEKNCKKCMSFGKKCEGDCPCASKGKKDDKKDDKDDKKDDKKDKKDKKDDKKDKKDDKKKDKKKDKKAFKNLFRGVLKMSEILDDYGFAKSASKMIVVANQLLVEANDAVEEAAAEAAANPDVDATTLVLTETGGAPEDARLGEGIGGDFDFEDEDDIIAQLDAIERGESEGKSPVELAQELGLAEPTKPGREPGSTGWNEAAKESELFDPASMLEDFKGEEGFDANDGLAQANAEVETWLKKHAHNNNIEADADLSSLLITAEKEVEDYLIEKNLNIK